MPGDAQRDVAQVAKAGSKTLSQLVARILEQLALSAWLPAAALALLTAFVLKLGTIISAPNASSSPGAALSQAFGELGKTSIGGIVLLVIVVVVLTMVTQAFSFESIRL